MPMLYVPDEGVKQSITFRISSKQLAWLNRSTNKQSQQLRQDLAVLESLVALAKDQPDITLSAAIELLEERSNG